MKLAFSKTLKWLGRARSCASDAHVQTLPEAAHATCKLIRLTWYDWRKHHDGLFLLTFCQMTERAILCLKAGLQHRSGLNAVQIECFMQNISNMVLFCGNTVIGFDLYYIHIHFSLGGKGSCQNSGIEEQQHSNNIKKAKSTGNMIHEQENLKMILTAMQLAQTQKKSQQEIASGTSHADVHVSGLSQNITMLELPQVTFCNFWNGRAL